MLCQVCTENNNTFDSLLAQPLELAFGQVAKQSKTKAKFLLCNRTGFSDQLLAQHLLPPTSISFVRVSWILTPYSAFLFKISEVNIVLQLELLIVIDGIEIRITTSCSMICC